MPKKIFKLSVLGVLILYMAACGNKYRQTDISIVEKKLVNLFDADYMKFEKEFTDLILFDTSTIGYPFKQLLDSNSVYLHIQTSEDGNLRFYNWITPFGGTIPDYRNIVQYRSNGKVFSIEYPLSEYEEEEEGTMKIGVSYINIHTVKIGIKTYYLVEDWSQYDSGHGLGSINALTIENDKLKEAWLFKTQKDTLSSISYEYNFTNWYFTTNNGEGFDWICAYERNKNILYVPRIEKLSATDQYLLYQIKGNYFEYIGRDGGYWLHPTIRKFDCLVRLYETEKFRIRIDHLGNSKYRYVSWAKTKKMSERPDLVIENGVYDKEQKSFVFKNNDYTYISCRNDNDIFLIVKQGEKEILREKRIRPS